MLSIHQLSHHNHMRGLYKDLSFEGHPGEILGIVGSNGAGKSTLLHAIARLEKGVSLTQGDHLSFLPQTNEDDHCTILEVALKYQPYLSYVIGDIGLYSDMGGFSFEHKLQQQLPGFLLDSTMNEYSLGQRQWIRLVSLFLSRSEVLLLDEPTNYLDLEHIHLFKQRIVKIKAKSVILLVTHDRSLLDELVDKVLYLGEGGWELIEGGYGSLLSYQDMQMKSKINLSVDLKKQITRLSEETTRKKIWAGRTEKEKQGAFDKGFVGARAAKLARKAVQAEHKSLQKLEELKKAKPFVKKNLTLEVGNYVVYPKEVVKVENIGKKFDKVLFSNLSFELKSHDKVALCGPNGCGKSSLIRCLVGLDHNYTGKIAWNPHIRWHYLPQGLEGFFKGDSLAEHFSILNIDLELIRKRLGNMLLRDGIWQKDLKFLSPGEKMRVALVEAMVMQSEFLILDEPTNHIDIESLEVLDTLLNSFPGGFLFVSHDKQFLEHHADRIVKI